MSEETTVADQRLHPYRFVIAGLAVLLNFGFGLNFFAVSPITPLIMETYGINHSTASLLMSLVILVQVGFAIPGGMLVNKVPLKSLITLCWLLSSAPALTFLATGFPLVLGLRVIYGLSFGLLFPVMGPLLMQWFRPKELPFINSINIAGASLGITISTFTVAPMTQVLGWQSALSLMGGFSLVGMICWVVLGRTQDGARQDGGGLSVKGAWGILRSRTTLLLAMADAGPFALYTALVTWLPTFYYEVHGMTLSTAGSLVSLLPLTGVFAVLLAGLLPLRVQRRRPSLIVPGVLIGFAGFGTFLLADSVLVFGALVLLGCCAWFYLPTLLTIPMELPGATPEQVAMTLATIITLGGFLTFLSPLVVGATADVFGTYLPGFVLFSVLAWSLAVAGVLLPETGAVERDRS